MAHFFVDTNILIAHLRQKQPTMLDKAIKRYGEALASDLVIFELEVGARRAGREFEFRTHFSYIQTFPLSQPILIEAAVIQAELLSQNQTIGLSDTFIAATAIFYDLPLLTLNAKHFSRLERLKVLEIPER